VLYIVGGLMILVFVLSLIGNNLASTATAPSSGAAGAVTFCQAMRDTDFEIVCEPNSSSRTIRLVMHADNSEARKICSGAVAEFRKYSNALAGWRINIHTLYSGDIAAATCRF
jgi:hypothetical protein